MGLYERDFYGWTAAQADALRRRSPNEIDWDNLLEEIETLGRSVRSELKNRLSVLLMHLLKWTYQTSYRSRSWEGTIRVQRRDILELIDENPSLKAAEGELFARAYAIARQRAENETGLPLASFPEEAPFTLTQALDDAWLPGGRAA